MKKWKQSVVHAIGVVQVMSLEIRNDFQAAVARLTDEITESHAGGGIE
ncbi:MAG: hypothetical protein LV471_06680 [Nitrosomonas sp.]|nr:hypothetical protein [Nitrosomonas sp.]